MRFSGQFEVVEGFVDELPIQWAVFWKLENVGGNFCIHIFGG
jgi:hypothetical protein